MKKIKKIVSLMVLSVMFAMNFGSVVNASEVDSFAVAKECENEIDLPLNTDSSSQYFLFSDINEKMDSYGNFTFSYSYALQSDYFKPAGSTIRVYATATSSTSDQTYYISLYKSGQSSPLEVVTYTANGNQQYYDFSGLNTNDYHYLMFTTPILSHATITGSGKINYIQ